ncbi:nucleotidyltransferase family protein [Roseomonas sp. OT10]|uniref:nucleotidyltransferase family protein n=1 Tax=Roseomonas cutis TaxID=2897332 RepID=UPI001E46D0A0|nr:nucleotidyltransferase family protein [Roseomonas sp. OT10]UFN47468.1 nucleotidyltransferase family protein [Roseomonas sp. OT10]
MIALQDAMVLAAGLGQRMRPLTETTPKPLLTLEGQSLLDHVLDRLAASGVRHVVVNAFHLAPQIVAACAARTDLAVEVVVEDTLLETGGGVRNALPRLGGAPFAVINGDAFWLDGPTPALTRMAGAFEPATMDVLLLLVRTSLVEGDVGRGDFLLDPLGRVRRPKEREVAPYLFAGVQILRPEAFEGTPEEGPWSLNRLYDRAIEAGRCFAVVHDGAWFHLSTPPDLERTERRLSHGLVRLF